MIPSAKPRVSMASLSAVLVLALACLSFVAAAPTDAAGLALRDAEDHDVMAIDSRELPEPVDTLLPRQVESVVVPKSAPDDLDKRSGSAGLYWQQIIGNLKLDVTNPHDGAVGPRTGYNKFPNGASHINFRAYQKRPRNVWKLFLNLHIVRYTSASKECLYLWDSQGKGTIFDNCFDDWGTALREGVASAKSVIDQVLRNADPLAYAAVIVTVGVILLAALGTAGIIAI